MTANDEQLFKALAQGDINEVHILLTNGANANAVNSKGQTPLILAVNNVDCLELLLNYGADVDANSTGYTALMEASQLGYIDAVELLLSRGADVATISSTTDRLTALQIAATSSQIECIELLLKYGSNADAVDASGRTALMDAAARGDLTCLNILLHHGARVHFEDAVKLAVDGGHANCEAALRTYLKGKMQTIKKKKYTSLFKKVSMVIVCTALVVSAAAVNRSREKKAAEK
jgi:ankyrin repeat protein